MLSDCSKGALGLLWSATVSGLLPPQYIPVPFGESSKVRSSAKSDAGGLEESNSGLLEEDGIHAYMITCIHACIYICYAQHACTRTRAHTHTCYTYIYSYIHTYIHTPRQKDKQSGKPRDGQTARQTNRQKDRKTDRQAYRQTVRRLPFCQDLNTIFGM